MSGHLILLFLFRAGLTGAFTFFLTRVVVAGSRGPARQRTLRGVERARNAAAGAALLIPLLMFIAFWKSLPEGEQLITAVLPAVWIFMILLAVVLGLTFAIRSPAKHLEDG